MIAYCGPACYARSARSRRSRVSLAGHPCDACVAPAAASFRDPFADIARTMRRYTIAETCSLGVALATALISQTGSYLRAGLVVIRPVALRLRVRFAHVLTLFGLTVPTVTRAVVHL
jgi:hypothetical protein